MKQTHTKESALKVLTARDFDSFVAEYRSLLESKGHSGKVLFEHLIQLNQFLGHNVVIDRLKELGVSRKELSAS
jgi:hypothetical protein